MKTYDETRKELDSNIPRDVISRREGGSGVKLDYLEGYYVIDRLNQVLGQGNWSTKINDLKCVREGEVSTNYGTKYSVHYICMLSLHGKVGDTNFSFEDVGYGDGSDKNTPGKAHELAVKEAVTDALKRCAKNLGRSMGLALYDKTQEYVDNEPAKKVDSDTSRTASVTDNGIKENRNEAATVGVSSRPAPKSNTTSKAVKETIKKAVARLFVIGALKKEEYVSMLKTDYNVDKTDALSDSDATALYSKIKTTYAKELNTQ